MACRHLVLVHAPCATVTVMSWWRHSALAAVLMVALAGLAVAQQPVPQCQQQGLLRLGGSAQPPYAVQLPFCERYQCSCCNVSHALTIQRSVRDLLTDEELSPGCKAAWAKLACRVCDPQVGVGHKPLVCRPLCDETLRACAEDFHAHSPATGHITPCTGEVASMLVCSRLRELVRSGEEFCRATGHRPAAEDAAPGSCFDASPVGPQGCERAPPRPAAAPTVRTTRGRRRLTRRRRAQLQAGVQLLLCLVLASAIAWGVLSLLQGVMRPAVPVAPSREVMARAAEARAAQRRR